MSPKIAFLRQKMARRCCFFFLCGRFVKCSTQRGFLTHTSIKRHSKPCTHPVKSIVFMSSCKQVECICEALQWLFLNWYPARDSLWETKRMEVFFFHKNKAAVLLCTDIAAHAPCCTLGGTTKLSWRYQYLVGRTARYEEDGKALLFLLPSEKESIFISEVPPNEKEFYSHNPGHF